MGEIVDRLGQKFAGPECSGLEAMLHPQELGWIGTRYSEFQFKGLGREGDGIPVGVAFRGVRKSDGKVVEATISLPIPFPSELSGIEIPVFQTEMRKAMVFAAIFGLTVRLKAEAKPAGNGKGLKIAKE